MVCHNRPFYQYGGHIELIRFKEYYRMPRAFSSLVLEIWSFTVYFLGKRRTVLHPNTGQESFFPLPSYSKKTLRKNVPKSARKYKRNVLMPPGHPIILLKSN